MGRSEADLQRDFHPPQPHRCSYLPRPNRPEHLPEKKPTQGRNVPHQKRTEATGRTSPVCTSILQNEGRKLDAFEIIACVIVIRIIEGVNDKFAECFFSFPRMRNAIFPRRPRLRLRYAENALDRQMHKGTASPILSLLQFKPLPCHIPEKLSLSTGAAGRLASRLCPLLEPHHDLLLTDLVACAENGVHALDIRNEEACVSAFAESDIILHCAIAPYFPGDSSKISEKQVKQYHESMFEINVKRHILRIRSSAPSQDI